MLHVIIISYLKIVLGIESYFTKNPTDNPRVLTTQMFSFNKTKNNLKF